MVLQVLAATAASPAEQQGRHLNNLVTEILRIESLRVNEESPISFLNPRDGWVYISLRAKLNAGQYIELAIADTAILRLDTPNPQQAETMRWLTKGEHKLRLRASGAASVDLLQVHTMPETHFVRFPQEPRFPELGVFDWPWLKAHVLSSVNTVVGFPGEKTEEGIEEWTASGRKFISYGSLPHDPGLTGPAAFDYWYKNPGFQDARLSGMIADEFSGRQHPLYPAWIEGMRLLGEAAKGSGKAFYAYCGGPGMYSRPEARSLVRTVFDSGFYMAWERYHHEMPSLDEARAFMDALLGKEMTKWRAAFPECQRQIVLVLGIFATGPDLDVQPDANYKVWMDMQMQYLATHPQFDGLFGVHWWYSGAASEELLRWQNALYRHYCIEGATDLLSERFGWTYMLDHVRDPDFYQGLDAWTAEPAAQDSLKTGYLERYAEIENRYWHRGGYPDDPAGNTYLWMKRQANAPNKVSQEIGSLVTGARYTVQMITADYADIVAGRSEEKRHAVALEVDGAEVLPEGSYRSIPVSSPWSHEQLPFKNGPAWFNHHRVMFRASAPQARLTISDWAAPTEPGGPAGQELMINYIQLQPYFEE